MMFLFLLTLFIMYITHYMYKSAAMAEWLRRLTRNQMGYARAGSIPARSV